MNQEAVYRILKTLGESYYQKDVTLLDNLISDDCSWKSINYKAVINGKTAIVDYYHSLFLSTPEVNYRYRIIFLKENNNRFLKGTLGLLIRAYHAGGYYSLLLLLTFKEEGRIIGMDIVDPLDCYYGYYPLPWQQNDTSYSQNDILYEEEIFEYCFESMFRFFVNHHYQILTVNRDIKAVPTLVAKKNNRIYVILLKACAALGGARRWPDMENDEISQLTKYAEQVHGTTFVAVMNISSKDEARKQDLIALVGDHYTIEAYPLSRAEWVDGCIRYYLIW